MIVIRFDNVLLYTHCAPLRFYKIVKVIRDALVILVFVIGKRYIAHGGVTQW